MPDDTDEFVPFPDRLFVGVYYPDQNRVACDDRAEVLEMTNAEIGEEVEIATYKLVEVKKVTTRVEVLP